MRNDSAKRGMVGASVSNIVSLKGSVATETNRAHRFFLIIQQSSLLTLTEVTLMQIF